MKQGKGNPTLDQLRQTAGVRSDTDALLMGWAADEIERLRSLLIDVIPTISEGIEALAVLSQYDEMAPLESIRKEIANLEVQG